MFRLIEGSVRLAVIRSDGREAVFMLFEPGDCFGDSSLVDGGARPQTAEALTNVWVDVLDREAFALLRAKFRAFDDALLKLLAKQMRMVSEQYTYSNLHDLRSRVAARLVEAARSFGTEVDGGTRLTLRLNQSELAAMAGASRQSVNKVLQRLQSEGLVTIEYGNVLVRDLSALSQLSL